MTANANTDAVGNQSLQDIAGAIAGAAAALSNAASAIASVSAAGGQSTVDQAASTAYQRDVMKDVSTDERFNLETADRSSVTWLNTKRTYDLHQSRDLDVMVDKAKHQAKLDSMEVAEREQRMLHQAKINAQEILDREQSRRHTDDMHTQRYIYTSGFAADTVQEAFAERVANAVCARMAAAK